MGELTVLTWWWRQDNGAPQYSAEHVNIWAAMVRRHLALPHRIACVTDHPAGLDPSIEIIAPPGEFADVSLPSWGRGRPQCLRRLAMFRPDAARIFGDRIACMDIDLVIAGPLDPLLGPAAGDFRIMEGTGPGRPYNGSLILLAAGARPQVYERFTPAAAAEAGQRFLGSDQAWLAHVLGPAERTFTAEDGVDWRRHRIRAGDAEGVRLMAYPGTRKPWDLVAAGEDPWTQEHYRGAAAGACLVLSDGPSLWRDVEARLDLGPIGPVIAAAAAAEHWPGPLAAVGRDEAHALRLARMIGFSDVVLCGGRDERMAA
jgi:hypothetical protein